MEFLKLSSIKLSIVFLCVFFVVGCGLLEPFVDRRRNPGVDDISKLYSGPSTPNAPVICYNGLYTDDDELQSMATNECLKHNTGNYAEFQKKTYFDGKLLLPAHAYYKCIYKED